MSVICKVEYIPEEKKTSITFDGQEVDCSRIQSKTIQEWAAPFLLKGIRWRGFLQEMKLLNNGNDDFVVQFHGSDSDMEILRNTLRDSNVRVISSENNVVLFYQSQPLMTRITVNGKPFDTSRLEGRSIDEYVYAFEIADKKWLGIFRELEEYIGIPEYSMQFVGDKQYMLDLIETAPDTVSIIHRDPVRTAPKKNTLRTMHELAQKAAESSDTPKNKIISFWNSLSLKMKALLCSGAGILIAGVVLIIVFGNFSSYSDYYYLVEDAVIWSFDEDKEDREDAREEILDNMPIGRSDMFWFNDKQIESIRTAKDYNIKKIRIKKENVGSREREDSYISPEYMTAHWGIEDEQIKAFLKYEVTVEAAAEVKGKENTTLLVGTGYLIEPKEEYKKSWSAFVTGIEYAPKKED